MTTDLLPDAALEKFLHELTELSRKLLTARAYLAAMREPSVAMCEAGIETGAVNNDTYYIREDHIRTVYRAMIDEALLEFDTAIRNLT